MKLKQLLASLLCLALLLCSAPIALAAPDTATVAFWFADGSDVQTAFDLTVTDGTAESFGFTVSAADHNGKAIETVTALDVLVAAHKAIYGDAFTAETADNYLSVSSGFMTKAFGLATSNLGFTINDAMPHDDTYVESSYGGYYTGYAIDTARVKDGDRICLFVYKDAYWSDILPLFRKTAVKAATNEAFTISVSGYSVMYYGCDKQANIDANTKPLAGVTVESTQDFKTFTTVGTLGEDGRLSVTLPQAGEYYLVVRGTFDDADMGDLPLIVNFCQVSVTERVDPTLTVSKAPDKTVYQYGETLDPTGLILCYTDEFGETMYVTEGFACAPTTFSESGKQTVTVLYKGLTATFDVTVEPDTSGAVYFPFFVRPVICFKNSMFTFGIRVFFFDLTRTAPIMSKAFTFSISL